MSPLGERILVIEDEVQIRKFICYSLESEGYHYMTASNGTMALQKLLTENVDLILLDLGLPDMDGITMIERVREWSEIPIIVVSARDQDKEKAEVLDLGADDYLTKPFSATELLARIRVALRHVYRQVKSQTVTHIQIGDLRMEFDKHLLFLEEKEVHLTPMEYSLLSLLCKNANKVLTTDSILKELWGVGYGKDTQALRSLMAGLRRKIEKNPAKPKYIITEVGVGYRMADL